MEDYLGKVVIVTGASSGIGAKIATSFAKRGASLIVTGRNAMKLNETAEKCKAAGSPNVLQFTVDLQNINEIDKIIKETIEELGRIDVLINNAASCYLAFIGNINYDQFDEMMAVNVKAPIRLTELCIPYLEKTKGNIVNISSMASQNFTIPGGLTYSATKAALDYFVRSASLSIADKGIRINNVNPAFLNTELFRNVVPDEAGKEQFMQAAAPMHPLGKRLIEAKEVVDAVMFLASSNAAMITGTCLNVDGGRILTGQ
ncbi:putative oxidoreductase TM_0325 [Clavelina lepadiformis]|uniref:putative oxidoreductase TM_0325 n=1 Tax=Clavelina lepadiformis TaxID=159417 RepID=UPI00404125A1